NGEPVKHPIITGLRVGAVVNGGAARERIRNLSPHVLGADVEKGGRHVYGAAQPHIVHGRSFVAGGRVVVRRGSPERAEAEPKTEWAEVRIPFTEAEDSPRLEVGPEGQNRTAHFEYGRIGAEAEALAVDDAGLDPEALGEPPEGHEADVG